MSLPLKFIGDYQYTGTKSHLLKTYNLIQYFFSSTEHLKGGLFFLTTDVIIFKYTRFACINQN